jgi:hypothetical protein
MVLMATDFITGIWVILFAITIVIALRILDRAPITYRNVSVTELAPYMTTFVVNSRAGAWVQISDPNLGAWILIRKMCSDGTKLRFTIHCACAMPEHVERMIEGTGGLSISGVVHSPSAEDTDVLVEVVQSKLSSTVSAAVRDLLVELGSPPGVRVTIRGRGRPDPEGWRPMFEALARRSGRTSSRVGQAGLEFLARRRRRQSPAHTTREGPDRSR